MNASQSVTALINNLKLYFEPSAISSMLYLVQAGENIQQSSRPISESNRFSQLKD